MRGTSWRTGWFVWAALSVAACRSGSNGSFTVERVDVRVQVLPAGAVEIHEQSTVRVVGPGAVTVERMVEAEQADAMVFLSATLDGTLLTPNTSGDQSLTMSDGRVLRVRWTLPPGGDAPHVLSLVYRVAGAVAVQGAHGSIRLPVIPAERRETIAAASVVLELPPAAHLFDGTGIAEAGWTVERRPNGIAAERRGLTAAEGATLIAQISIEPGSFAAPVWQVNQEWSRELVPAWISGALFILVTGGGILWIIRFQYPNQSRGDSTLERNEVRSGLHISGIVTIALSALTAVVMWITLGYLGLWPMAIPASIFLVGLVFVAVSGWFV